MREFNMVGISSGLCCSHHLNIEWWNKFVVLDVGKALKIYFVVKGLKWDVLKVDDNQDNELENDSGKWLSWKWWDVK